MNDRFLFRGKRVDNGELVVGFLCYVLVNEAGKQKKFTAIQYEKEPYYIDFEIVQKSTVGQCTGLKDKKGKLIFEGDILLQTLPDNKTRAIQIKWNQGNMCFDYNFIQDFYNDNCKVEILGNIHDNPELLG